MATCAPRITAADLEGCLIDDATEDQIAAAIEVALELFDLATKGAYPGMCQTTIRPCVPRVCGCTFSTCSHTSPMDAVLDVSCGCTAPGRCVHTPAIRLPHTTAVSVDAVTIGASALPITAYRLIPGARVVRLDGEPWPSQDFAVPEGSDGAWSITYTYGRGIPAAARRALASMIGEIVKGVCGRPCALPQGMRIREVNGMGPVPEFDRYRVNLLTGYPLVDDWITLSRGGATHHRPSVSLVRRPKNETRRPF